MSQNSPGNTISRPKAPKVRKLGKGFGKTAANPLTLIGAVLAVLGFLAFVFFGNSGGSHAGPVSGDQREVVVASHDLTLRTQLQAGDVTTVKYQVSDVPPGAFQKVDDAKGLVTFVNITKGQPLTSNLLVKSADLVGGSPSTYLPLQSGYVALTIPTSEQQGVAGYIQSGDYISMLVIVNGARGSNSRTVFTNLHVIRLGPAVLDPSTGAAKQAPPSAGTYASMTVMVTQCQAEYINWFSANAASVKYTLESYHDYKPVGDGPDASCASVDSARGVTLADVAAHYPGIFS